MNLIFNCYVIEIEIRRVTPPQNSLRASSYIPRYFDSIDFQITIEVEY